MVSASNGAAANDEVVSPFTIEHSEPETGPPLATTMHGTSTTPSSVTTDVASFSASRLMLHDWLPSAAKAVRDMSPECWAQVRRNTVPSGPTEGELVAKVPSVVVLL